MWAYPYGHRIDWMKLLQLKNRDLLGFCLLLFDEQNFLFDSFRHLNPQKKDYSWVGRTGDGYRYDHCFVSNDLSSSVEKCYYLHEPRNERLSDHAAIILNLNL